jgi:hypothetical protein
MNELRVLGIHVFDRIKEAGRTQKILSKYAFCIKTRMGFHELNADVCSRTGFIILELKGDAAKWEEFEKELMEIGGLDIKKMSFLLPA